MRSKDEIRTEFSKCVAKRDTCPKGSQVRRILNERIVALAWVLERPEVPDVIPSEEVISLMECLW